MVELGMAKRESIRHLSVGHGEIPVRAAAEGRMGRVWVPLPEESSFCLISLGAFSYLLGLPPRGAESIDLYLTICRECADTNIVPGSTLWCEWLEEQFAGRFRTSARYALSAPEQVEIACDRNTAAALPDLVRLKKLDAAWYRRAIKETEQVDVASIFADEEQFLQFGIGYLALHGNRIVGGCAAYAFPEGLMEVKVATAEAYRNKGIATALTSRLLEDCADSGIERRWEAANLFSSRMAEKFGYRPDREYMIYRIEVDHSEEE